MTGIRREAGFTVLELMVAVLIAMLVLTAALTLIDTGGRASARLSDKAETVQRARIGMEKVVRVLRTQVCLDATTPPIAAGTADSITFYSDTAPADDTATESVDERTEFRPRKVRLTFDPAGRGKITRETWDTTSATPSSTPPAWSFGAADRAADRRDLVVDNVGRHGANPVFSYAGWQNLDTAVAVPLDTALAAATLPPNSIAKVVKVNVSFQAGPTSGRLEADRKTALSSSVIARNADFSGQPTDKRQWGPRCI